MARFWRLYKIDVTVAAVFTAITQYEIWVGPSPILNEPVVGSHPLLSLAALGFTLPLAFTRALPIPALVIVMAQWGLPHPPDVSLNLLALFLAVVLVVYLAATSTSGRTAIVAAVIIGLGQVGADLPELKRGDLSAHFGEWVFFSLAWVLGKTVRLNKMRGDRLALRAIELERRRDSDVQEALVDERARIARELHDVVAHSVSLMVLQAGAARQALDWQPGRARQPLLAIEATGREAMGELRRMLSVLRDSGEVDELAPQPSLRHLDVLLGQMQAAGMPVRLAVEGSVDDLPKGVDLSAYRIIQEALTNSLKHSSHSAVDVHVRRIDDAIEVEVQDAGPALNGNEPGVGHGLIGMRERAALYGGKLEAGQRSDGGFEVKATLPLDAR
ncbi:MAG: sensor histidine kinase [Candidatus Dormiibacterota bacterium]